VCWYYTKIRYAANILWEVLRFAFFPSLWCRSANQPQKNRMLGYSSRVTVNKSRLALNSALPAADKTITLCPPCWKSVTRREERRGGRHSCKHEVQDILRNSLPAAVLRSEQRFCSLRRTRAPRQRGMACRRADDISCCKTTDDAVRCAVYSSALKISI
jgi:hypothetical protein